MTTKSIWHLFYFMLNSKNTCYLRAFIAFDVKKIENLCFEDNCINIEVFEIGEDIRVRLIFRRGLGKDSGMLFRMGPLKENL